MGLSGVDRGPILLENMGLPTPQLVQDLSDNDVVPLGRQVVLHPDGVHPVAVRCHCTTHRLLLKIGLYSVDVRTCSWGGMKVESPSWTQ